MNDVISLTKELISRPSVTPDDAGCQEILIKRLVNLGFEIEPLPFGEVKNFWAKRGNSSPLFVFVGHTDVVPPGPLEHWTSPPFQPEVRDNYLYGRGAADMKGSIAAMLIACEKFITTQPQHQGSIAWLITSDEEGPSVDGTAKVVEYLKQKNEKISWCLVGEPGCENQFGDTIKIGRRGTLSANLVIYGKQGHIAYPQLADNPIHRALAALAELTNTVWDSGNSYFQPTSFQFSNIHAGTGAGNIIPGELQAQFNLRYSPEVTADSLQKKITSILEQHNLQYNITWHHSGQPFLTKPGKLVNTLQESIKAIAGITANLSTHGGTSDGRFIAPLCDELVEFGPCNRTIHHINECVAVSDLINLVAVYEGLLTKLLG